MENTEIKMINDEDLKEVSGGVEKQGIYKEEINFMPFHDDCIIVSNYGFRSPCLHRVKMKKRIDNINKN